MKTTKVKQVIAKDQIKAEIKPQPVFEAASREEIDKILNEKRQNKVQALKDYFVSSLVLEEQTLLLRDLENTLANGGTITDTDFNIPMSKERAEAYCKRFYIQLKFDRTRVLNLLNDLKTTWNMTEEDIDKKAQAWFVDGKDIK